METLESLKDIEYIGFFVSTMAFLIGLKFPDFDFKLKLQHRNILTHSPIVIILLLNYYIKEPSEIMRYFIIGFSFAIGIHLIFDLFPKGWGGGSLLKIPIVALKCSPATTINLFKIFILISLGIAIKYTKIESEFWLLLLMGTVTILKNMRKEKKLIRPLFVYILLVSLLGSFKYEGINFYVKKSTDIGISTFKLWMK